MLTEVELAEKYGQNAPYVGRVIQEVKPPAGVADDKEFYAMSEAGWIPNVSFLRKHFYREGRLTEDQIMYILRNVKDVFAAEPNVLKLRSPITICGDIHGQYYDLAHFMSPEIGGNPLKTQYLFLGDYVDRGWFGVECVLFLFAIKLVHPRQMNMLRGNHESRHLTDFFTFKLECKRKYSEKIYNAFIEVFKALPLAAVVDDKYFCVHGGIGPDLNMVDDINRIQRISEVPTNGLMCDLLWSDPAEESSMGLESSQDFMQNRVRGCSYTYSYNAVTKFLRRNNLTSMIRGHEAQKDGFRMHRFTEQRAPSVITVFSAPNYCDAYGNKGAILISDGNQISIKWYHHSPHPFWLQNFANAFTWSLPFVIEKSLDILQAVVDVLNPEDLEDETTQPTELHANPRKRMVMSQIFQALRVDSEGATEFRNLPVPIHDESLGSAAEEAAALLPDFEHARESDILNERLPPTLIDVREADDFLSRRGPYALEESAAQLARKTSVGTTYSSSPSTRKRSVEVTINLMRKAASLAAQERMGNRKENLSLRIPEILRALAESKASKTMEEVLRDADDE